MNRSLPIPKLILLGLAIGAAVSVFAQVTPSGQAPAATPEFSETRAMIAMRDGVKLNTVIFVPKNAAPALPFLIMRTPYGAPE
ncbi:MAG: hypothetical protein IH583_15200, partial [Candidatus Aminicenantes bacterium]|nr:hypothetical protein [Candidatus Aminicenantes bacterium]